MRRKCPMQNRQRSQGFTLIEALVALLVISFGMLAIAGMQITLTRGSDLAKQRSEAVRLGQLKIEELRSFETVTPDATKYDYANDVVGGNDTVAPDVNNPSNVTYTRTWTVTKDGVNAPAADEPQKWITVRVQWADRTSTVLNQEVTLRTVISRSDPIGLGTLFTGPGGSKARSPKNRNINIPYPALTLPGKLSSFKPPPSTANYVFDNATGDILGYCDDSAIAASLSSGTALSFAEGAVTAGCTRLPGYLLSGYIHFLNSIPSGTEKNVDEGISNPNNSTRELTVNVDFVGGGSASCFAQRQKVVSVGATAFRTISSATRVVVLGGNSLDPNDVVTITTSGNHGFSTGQIVSINGVNGFDGVYKITVISNNTFTYKQEGSLGTGATGAGSLATLVQQITIPASETAPTGYNATTSQFVAYTCVVQPVDDDGNPVTRSKWSGQFFVTPDSSWALGTAPDAVLGDSNTRKVCRFSGDYYSDDAVSNAEHPLVYKGVTGAIDNQNYLVVPYDLACPTDDETAPLTGDYINTNTLLHQTSATSPFGGAYSDSSQWGAGVEDGSQSSFPMICSNPAICPEN